MQNHALGSRAHTTNSTAYMVQYPVQPSRFTFICHANLDHKIWTN